MTLGALRFGPAPYREKPQLMKTKGLWYAKEKARTHGFNAKNYKSNWGKNVTVWFAPNQTVKVLLKSQSGMVALNYYFLR